MKLHELFNEELDEDISRRAGILGLGSAFFTKAAGAAAKDNEKNDDELRACTAESCDSNIEKYLLRYAKSNGIDGNELAAFMAQMAHETMGFKRMEETGNNRYFLRYDINGNPAKARALGNTAPGDGQRYKGRGFIHLTGKDNYQDLSNVLNIDLVKNPALAAKPAVAASIAVWYWKNKVRPHVSNWNDVRSVTKKINPGMNGLPDRTANFDYYKEQLPVISTQAASIEFP